MIEAEKYVKAEKNAEGGYSIVPNEILAELIKLEARKYNLSEEKVVEMIFAEGCALVIVEERGEKQLVLRDPKTHTENPVKVFNFKETTS